MMIVIMILLITDVVWNTELKRNIKWKLNLRLLSKASKIHAMNSSA